MIDAVWIAAEARVKAHDAILSGVFKCRNHAVKRRVIGNTVVKQPKVDDFTRIAFCFEMRLNIEV